MIKLLKLSLSLILLFPMPNAAAPADAQSIHARLRHALEADPQKRDLSWITSEQRTTLIQIARSSLNNPDPNSVISAKQELAVLGDSETLKTLSNETKAGNGTSRNILLTYGDEHSLPFVLDSLATATDTDAGGGAGNLVSSKDLEVLGCYRIIARSKAFPEPTRNWAKQIEYRARTTMIGLGPQGDALSSLMLWWTNNKDAVIARRYQDASWLPPQK